MSSVPCVNSASSSPVHAHSSASGSSQSSGSALSLGSASPSSENGDENSAAGHEFAFSITPVERSQLQAASAASSISAIRASLAEQRFRILLLLLLLSCPHLLLIDVAHRSAQVRASEIKAVLGKEVVEEEGEAYCCSFVCTIYCCC